ncbi:hypothetical protein L210DRAFT_2426082 [Boletus edulis BED1]|uniref:Uncharacterized protein n=1 Tax=Boletus edulis BED1 TaxID=1328754 RepID=A0AAD4C8Q5_BOLED|nr:hypothetical protein L210DRAFT_2426082 [Boletus edulis BED1]
MHGSHKGRLTPTIYPRNPWYSCKSMACTRVCLRRQYTRETHYTHVMVPKTPSDDRIHGTHKGRPDADKIPAKAMHGTHKGSADADKIPAKPVMVPQTPSHDHIHGTHKGRPDADKIPAKAMHGTHKGRLTPTIYPRNPWYSCKSMACTRVC